MVSTEQQKEPKVGDRAVDLIAHLAASRPRYTFSFVQYEVEPGSMARVKGMVRPEFLERLRELWDSLSIEVIEGLPGILPRNRNWEVSWEAVRSAPFAPDRFEDVVREVLKHDFGRQDKSGIEMLGTEVTVAVLESMVERLPEGNVLGFCSRCRLEDGSEMHFPLMDFRCPLTPYFRDLARKALQAVGQRRGFLLKSGRSCHYYGSELLLEEDWRIFMASCILLSPLADARYIAHRLLDGLGVLRVSATSLKPLTPVIWDLIDV